MYKDKTVGVVVPAYNEERLIKKTIETMPMFVDSIVVVNDGSKDATLEVVKNYAVSDPRITIVNHETNKGLGQSLIDGYLKSLEIGSEIVAVMAGDAQMAPEDLPSVLDPIAEGRVDYTKGSRLLHEDVVKRMPRYRLWGNSILTILTKFATGYWHVIDPQSGYTAISRAALKRIPIRDMIKGYGYNAHILHMLNLDNFKVQDVEIEPVYGDEKSKIKLWKYIPTVSSLLLKLFLRRIFRKYIVRDFNPLFFFYWVGIITFFLSIPFVIRFFILFMQQSLAPTTTLTITIFLVTVSMFSTFFAMWFDLEDNRKLRP